MAAHISAEKRREIENLFKEGKSQSEVERASGCAKNTVRNIRESRQGLEVTGAPDSFSVSAVSALVDAEGRVVQRWVKSKRDSDFDIINTVKAAFEGYHIKAKPTAPPKTAEADLLTVYNIADHHLGLFAWGKETGADYDLAIGERVLRTAMADLVSQAPSSETGIVLNLGDFLHADNAENKTARSGNVLDVDTRYAKVLEVGVKLLVDCVSMALVKHKRVIVRCVPGNHDPISSLALTCALAAFFSANPRVQVDTDPSKFFFYQHGEVMIGATHGDMVKPAQMPGVMAAYQAKMWGNTRYRYAYLGHIHHKAKGGEENGVVWETFQSLAAKDAWHHGAGYSSGRSMVAITHHVTRGEVYRHTVTARLEAA